MFLKTISFFAGSLLLLSTAAPVCAIAEPAPAVGSLTVDPCVTVYVVVGKTPETARLTIQRRGRLEGDRLMVRAFNPDERLTWWQYLEPGVMKSSYGPGDEEVWGIPVTNPVNPKTTSLFLDTNIPLQGEGVHQIRVGAGANNSVASLTFAHGSSYGVSFQNGSYSPWKGQPKTMYIFVPPHAEELVITGGPVRIFDEKNAEVISLTDGSLKNSSKAIKIAPASIGTVWRVEFPQVERWTLRAAGFPFILCPTAEAAKAIHASVEELPDGTVISHKFQKRIAEILPKVLAPENVGKAENLVVAKITNKEEWMKNPERNLLFFNSILTSIGPTLTGQNIDPHSYWGGTVGCEERAKLPAPENRWDRLQTVKGLWAGVTPRYATREDDLALGALVNEPFNPYYGKKELLYRATAIALRDLMTVRESEIWGGAASENSSYAGNMAFAVGQKSFPLYAIVAPHLPAEIRDVWTEALRHIVDRSYPDALVTCRNQSSHYLTCYEDFAEGSGEPRYKELARLYAKRFIDGQSPAGYAMEQCGPDASYVGMTHWHMAVYYQQSKDPAMLEAIKKSYTFFNHTVAPEPNGSMLGGFNFNHRVGYGFFQEQWSGAKGILNSLPEVGIWSTVAKRQDKAVKAAEALSKQLDAPLPTTLAKYGGGLERPRFLYWEKPNTTGTWPALESNSFTRNFGDELMAIKRPGYYTVIFVGKPAPSAFYVHNKDKFRDPLPGNVENKGGTGGDAPGSTFGHFTTGRFITPLTGGGMSLFWTPAYGSAVIAANWTPLTHHGLVATTAEGKRFWEDYMATGFKLSPDNNSLTLTGKVEGMPLKYERRYDFKDQEVGVDLTLTADKDVRLGRLIENIPLKVTPGSVKIEVDGEQNGQAKASRIAASEGPGKGMEIVFDQRQDLTIQRNGMQRTGLKIGRAEVALPAEIKAGASVHLHYTLRPVAANP